MASADPQSWTLADRLNKLFATVRQADGSKHTNAEVAAFVRDHTGDGRCSREYMSQLRTGKATNPTKRVLEALAKFFDVSAAYFFDDAYSMEVSRQLDQLVALRDELQAMEGSTEQVMLRTLRELSADDQKLVEEMIDRLHDRRTTSPGSSGESSGT